MIAVVTSTLKPADGQNKGLYSFEERLLQTQKTLTQLVSHGFKNIYLVDNSPSVNQAELRNIFADFKTLKAYHILQYQFVNKGINELLMLLFISEHLKNDEPVFKISGRYYPTASFVKPSFTDFAVKGYNYHAKIGVISTRGYWVKDAVTLQNFLQKCLAEVFTYPQRIVGVRSFLNKIFVKKSLKPVNISIEFAAANVLKKDKYQVTQLEAIHIEGFVAGAGQHEKIAE